MRTIDPQGYSFHVAGAVDPEVYDDAMPEEDRPFEFAVGMLTDCSEASNPVLRILSWSMCLDVNPLLFSVQLIVDTAHVAREEAERDIKAVRELMGRASIGKRERHVAAEILADVTSKKNMVMRLFNWALVMQVSPPDCQSYEKVGAYTGVGRQASSKDSREISETFPQIRARCAAVAERHRVTNRPRIKLTN